MSSSTSPNLAALLNDNCQCITLDDALLDRALLASARDLGHEQLVASHPHLFSRSAVFVPRPALSEMAQVVAAVERVTALPSYIAVALADAHAHARVETKAHGVFSGFDFHLSEQGPQLIEINTNAGGALLNVVLRSAQRACCEPVAQSFGVPDPTLPDFIAMFEQEWRTTRAGRTLTSIAIVDDEPERQYLYPEFQIFQRACEARGYTSFIADARELSVLDDRLTHRGRPIDMVYNRLTDFWLEQPEHAALAEAFRRDLAVVTPHPRAYALYADKFRLATLSDAEQLRALGVAAEDVAILTRHIPRTRIVRPEQREQLWQERAQLFFKPQTGFGGKAAYRGDKITKRVFEQLFQTPYVAQALVPPSQRKLEVSSELRELKLDVRNFCFAGQVQLVCARLYQGQTTNFRSAGGGFAPIYGV